MKSEDQLCTIQVSEEEATIVVLALLELASRYTHMLEVCEFGDHEEYAEEYRERLDKVHELITTFREDDDFEYEVDPDTGEVKKEGA